ncbi:MAG: hypothetical protein J5623_03795 [Clostridiales bacterium]|nr:hypothetical protein [Clostridiales bacterium]
MDQDKKQLLKSLGMCLVGFLLFAGAGFLLVFDVVEKTSYREKITYGLISGFLSLLCIGTAAVSIYGYYVKHVKPLKYPDEPKSDEEVKRETDVHKKLPGKDMYDVIRLYRKRNFQTRAVVVAFCCFLVVLVCMLKITGEYHIHIGISVAVAVVALGIAFAVAGKAEFSYSGDKDFKEAIERAGADPVRLNADFMSGAHFALRDGLVVLGRDYLVIFAKSLCEVLDVSDISLVTKECVIQKVQGGTMKICMLKIMLNDERWLQIGLRDEKETDLMLNEFRLRAVPCKDGGERVMNDVKVKKR